MKIQTRPPVKLTGTDGNAFAVLGVCRRAALEAGWSDDEIAKFMTEAMSGDYDFLIGTAMKHFDVE